MKRIFLIVIAFMLSGILYSKENNEIDSLRLELQKADEDTVLARLNIDIGIKLIDSNPDSAFFYYNQAEKLLAKNETEMGKALKVRANIRKAYIELTNNSNPQEALEILDSALLILDELEQSDDVWIFKIAISEKVFAYNNYGNSYRMLGQYNEALDYYKKGLANAEKIGDDDMLFGLCYLHLGNIYRYMGELEKAMEYNLLAADAYEKINEVDRIAAVYNNIGNVFHIQGNYDQALDYYHKALKLFENMGDKIRSGTGYYNIGVVHYHLKNFSNAIEYFEKALEIREEIGDKKGMINSLMVMGVVKEQEKELDNALKYYSTALELAEELKDMSGIAHGYFRLGSVYDVQGTFEKALDYNKKALDIFEKTSNITGILGAENAIAKNYLSLGKNYNAIEYADKAYTVSKERGLLNTQLEAALLLLKANENLGNYEAALNYSKDSYDLSDSIFNEEKTKAISEMEARFQTEKKQLEIDNLLKDQALKESEIARQKEEVSRQKQLNNSLLIGIVLVIGFSILLFMQYRAKKKANILLSEQNAEINQKNEEIKAQRDEITTQRDFVIRQKEMIEASHQRITDSINYAQLIQSALLPAKEVISELLPEHLIYYKPRDIVSGDFYWVKKIKNYVVVVAADCTGHGVPGAFMSMLGIAFLNEIARREDVNTAADILNILRKEIKTSLFQKKQEDKANDGMDMSVLFFDKEKMQAHYAGAKNPLYIFRQNQKAENIENSGKVIVKENDDNVFIQVKGDSQSVSLTPSEKEFTNHKVKLLPGDMIYMFSDGYIDQISSLTNRRYTTTRFNNLLLDIYKEPVDKQFSLLEKTYNEWRKDNEQIDDIVILGIRV